MTDNRDAQCSEEHPDFADQRLCVFRDLLLLNGTLHFVSSKQQHISPVFVSWEKVYDGDQLLDIKVVHPRTFKEEVWTRAETVPQAGLFHQQHPVNYYHLFTEIVPTIHYTVCLGLGICTKSQAHQLRLFWVNKSGPSHPLGYVFSAPRAIQDLLLCLSPFPVDNVQDVTGPPLVLATTVAGLPRHVRFYHQKRDEWQKRFEDPPPLPYMQQYREQVAECLNLDLRYKRVGEEVLLVNVSRSCCSGKGC